MQHHSEQKPALAFRYFSGLQPYAPLWQAMQAYTDKRNSSSDDEIWLLEHSSVFTQGQAGKTQHILATGDIPIINTDRGGQVTYHGPGQLIAYFMIDLRRRGLGIRDIITLMEQTVISVLASYHIPADTRVDAPGVYVGQAKIASLGLRVRRGCTFHGLAFNIDMDLSPFLSINPCGHAGLQMVQLKDFAPDVTMNNVRQCLQQHLQQAFVDAEKCLTD